MNKLHEEKWLLGLYNMYGVCCDLTVTGNTILSSVDIKLQAFKKTVTPMVYTLKPYLHTKKDKRSMRKVDISRDGMYLETVDYLSLQGKVVNYINEYIADNKIDTSIYKKLKTLGFEVVSEDLRGNNQDSLQRQYLGHNAMWEIEITSIGLIIISVEEFASEYKVILSEDWDETFETIKRYNNYIERAIKKAEIMNNLMASIWDKYKDSLYNGIKEG